MEVNDILRQMQNDTIRALLHALDLHVPGELDHAERVAVYAVATGEELGMSDDELLTLRRAAALHDVGKVAVDRKTLRKLGELTEEEMDEIRRHAEEGLRIVSSLPWLVDTLPLIRHHHERWDGRGYPDGLKGESIPLGARIIAVAEAYDIMTTDMGWRARVQEDLAIAELRRCAGSQFDPQVVEAFAKVHHLIQPMGT